ncbi:MAG: hypothetical protein AT707_05690 [Pyrobaculum sp. JCHS_4]|jgi:hypothetical protein|nr:MAG: hypothetical protein AT707_05690 [Pyrobaculum sp. JCHS_4]
MRKYLKYFLISLFLLVLVFLALPFLAAPWACHIGGDVVCFGGAAEVTGSVWGPCNYTGAVEIIGGPPIDWRYSGNFKCITAGHAGGKTYAVFIRVVETDSIGDPFKSEAERDLCFCAKKRIVPCIFAKPAVSLARSVILVVDVEEGVSYLFIGYWVTPYHLNHSRFIFGSDGVYLVDSLVAKIGAKREIMGPLLKGCAYRVKIRLEPEKLIISQPLYNATTRAVRVG